MLSALDGPFREEVLMLRKKVVVLETAESDNERLRKDMLKLKLEMQEEKSEVELHFMNQMSEVMRENALKIEEITGQLQESNNVNRALSEQLNLGDPSPKEINKRIRDLESKHKNEISELVSESNRNLTEMERMKKELMETQKSRDELSAKLRESEKSLKNPDVFNENSVEFKVLTEKQQSPNGMDNSKAIQEIDNLTREIERLRSRLADALEHKQEGTHGNGGKNDAYCRTRTTELRDSPTNVVGSDKMTISNYEYENRQLKDTVKLLKDENNRITLTRDNHEIIKQSDSDSIDKDTAMAKLEKEIKSLKHSIVQIENENRNLKKKIDNEDDREQSREFGRSQSLSNVGLEKNGNRTSRIIQQFEQNLKIESELKKITHVSINTHTTNGKSNNNEIQSLRTEVKNLNEQLANERQSLYELRKVIHEFAATTRENRQVYESDPETAVKNIVETIEKRMQERVGADSVSIQRLMGRMEDFPDLAENLKDLKNEMTFQREQVYELEDELANQCEINCNLLKEISSLTLSNEARGRQNSHVCKASNDPNYGDDQKEIDRLMMEVAEVKSQLFNSDEAKSRLEDEIKSLKKKHSMEIDVYKVELESVQKIAQSESLREKENNILENKEFGDLVATVREGKLMNEKQISNEIKERNIALEKEIAKSVASLEKEYECTESEGSKLREKLGIRSALVLDEEQLQAEFDQIIEKNDKLNGEANHQHQRLKELQDDVDEKLRKVEITHESDQLKIKSLRDEVISLELEVSTNRDQVHRLTEELEKKEDISRKNIEALRSHISELQEELMMKQIELSDAQPKYKTEMAHLEEMIDSVRLEMSDTMTARDAEIQKLKILSEEKDSTSQRLEKEKEQLVFSMQDMMKNRRNEVDDLQSELMEMNTRLANQAREISTLKSRLEESQYEMKEMSSLRASVAELSHQLVTKNKREDTFETSSLELENNELRRRLKEESAERWIAHDKLQKYIAERGIGGPSRPVQVLRERNAALKFEVEKLTKKLKKTSEKVSETSIAVELEPYSVGNGVTRMAI